MKMMKIIRKVDIERQYERMLKLELDYELVSLFSAMQSNDVSAKKKSKKRLMEIQLELKALGAKEYVTKELSKALAPMPADSNANSVLDEDEDEEDDIWSDQVSDEEEGI